MHTRSGFAAGLLALALSLATAGVLAAEERAAAGVQAAAALESALRADAAPETMTRLLFATDPDVLQRWLRDEIRRAGGCGAPYWRTALQAALAAVAPERTAELLAAVLDAAVPELYGCILRQSHAELNLAGRDGYPLLVEAIRSAGILAPLSASVDDALIAEVLDTVLAPDAAPYTGRDAPFLNPLEPEQAASKS